MKSIKIISEYITLGQLLKFVGIISNGSLAKIYLSEEKVLVNGEIEARRGRKLYPGYKIETNKELFIIEK